MKVDAKIVTLEAPATLTVSTYEEEDRELPRNFSVWAVAAFFWTGFLLGVFTGLTLWACGTAISQEVQPSNPSPPAQVEMTEVVAAVEQLIAANKPEVAHHDPDTVQAIAQAVWGEARGCSTTEQAAVIWCILNRADSTEPYYPDDPLQVVQQTGQFDGYNPNNPVEPALVSLTEDVLSRWEMEKLGGGDVGRVLPADYLFFEGDGRENHFRRNYIKDGTTWDWSLESPYGEGAG